MNDTIISPYFDIWYVHRETKGRELVTIAYYLYQKHSLFKELMIDPVTFLNFVNAIQSGYKDVTYHNKSHGADVCQTVYSILVGCDLMTVAQLDQVDLGSMIIAGSIHDYEHLGNNNDFLV